MTLKKIQKNWEIAIQSSAQKMEKFLPNYFSDERKA